MSRDFIRRRELIAWSPLLASFARTAPSQGGPPDSNGFRPLFDGVSLKGWKRQPRTLGQPGVGKWWVENGVLIGAQDPPGVGSYLVTEETFGDFELQIEACPDWRADTGILVRTVPQGNVGFQVLLDHRPHGGIGGFYGNGLGNFHAWAYGFDGETDENGHLIRLVPTDPVEPVTGNHHVRLDFAAPPETFLRIWKLNGWNQFRIRSVGAVPHLTTWINGVKIAELDTAKMQSPRWNPEAALQKIGRTGHIALEVHSNGPKDPLGLDRWAPGAVCRWRNILVKIL